MAGKYYEIGVVTPIANIATALLDKYAAYNVDTNPTGYRELNKTSEYLIFSCTAITNMHIRVAWLTSTIRFQYGTGYTSGTVILNPVEFGCSYASTSAHLQIELVLHDDTFFMVTYGTAARASSKSIIIGKLSNGGYGVIGTAGPSTSTSYAAGAKGFVTSEDPVMDFITEGFYYNRYTSSNKLYKMGISIFDSQTKKLLLDESNNPVIFNNIVNVGHNSGITQILIGSDWIMSTGIKTLSAGYIGNCAWYSEFEEEVEE